MTSIRESIEKLERLYDEKASDEVLSSLAIMIEMYLTEAITHALFDSDAKRMRKLGIESDEFARIIKKIRSQSPSSLKKFDDYVAKRNQRGFDF